MEQALKIIIAKSPAAAQQAIACLRGIQAKSPILDVRYAHTVSIALGDPAAEFTQDERRIIAEALSAGASETRDYTLRIRMTEAERADLARQAEEADLSMSEYVRRRLF